MRDKWLVMVAIICALCGLVILFTMGQHPPAPRDIASLTTPGEYVACEGIVYYAKEKDGHLFVKIFDSTSINVPFFNFKGTISVGDLLYVEGVVEIYNEELEIIPRHYKTSHVLYGVCSDSQLKTNDGAFYTELDDGFHAVMGVTEGSTLTVKRELPSQLFVFFQGRISSVRPEKNSFTVFNYSQKFFSVSPVKVGVISGYGLQVEEEIVAFYHEWNELPPESIAQAKRRPKGYPVKVCGTVQSINESKGHLFLVIADSTGCILVPIFENVRSLLEVTEFYAGQTITVTGIVTVYKGAPEILPEAIHE